MGNQVNDKNSNKVAIIGMSCRLPGANNIEEFWQNLLNGVESITEFTDDELRAAGVEESLIKSPNYIKRRGIVNGAEYFDASFFGITPRDAEIMDPQHRAFLECSWHALEDAGHDPGKSDARIGVFGGTGVSWHLNSATNNADVSKYASGTSIVTGNDKDYVANRVSYKLNLTGPSFTVQSACSTSMVAVVLGVNSLLTYQCDMVLAGGATLELPERRGYLYQEGGLESSDGRCRTFDKDADGTIFSRGAGVVLLKRYDDAIADGDHIYATILGGAVNNDGSNKVGFTAPGVQGQVNVALEAIELAGISAETISYVEAHGTATSVGDPIEVSSLSQVFKSYSDRTQFCALGSVKTNIGHTDSASGVVGLIKTALSLTNKKIPKHLNFNSPNPKIDFANSPFFVNTELRDWNANGTPLRALVNSFGVGGTNACVILEEAEPVSPAEKAEGYKAMMLSAKSDNALEDTITQLHDYITTHEDVSVEDAAFTHNTGRRKFSNRCFLSFSDRNDLLGKLSNKEGIQKVNSEDEQKQVVFMFPGQGNQYHNMGKDLYENNSLFREVVDYCCDYLEKSFSLDLRKYIFSSKPQDEAKKDIELTYITQPSIFVISYAMARVVMAKGIQPDVLVGHSVGEYVAACLSGVLSLDDALRAVARRGALIQVLPGGDMLAVLQNEDKILPYLIDGVEIAAVNNPGLTVVAGPGEHIETFERKLTGSGFFSKKLSTSHAFHSAMMEPCLPEFAGFFEEITLSAPRIPIISTVTGHLLKDEEATDRNYWVRHVRNTVRFTDAINTCLTMGPYVFYEIGPGQSLESAVKRHLEKGSKHCAIRTMTTENESFDGCWYFETSVASLVANGGKINWEEYYHDQKRKKISLPVYPYQRMAYSIDFSAANKFAGEKKNVRFDDIKDWYWTPIWKRTPDLRYAHLKATADQSWLVFSDILGLGSTIAGQLKKEGKRVYEVTVAADFGKTGDSNYSLDLANRQHYDQLVNDIVKGGGDITHVVHLINYSKEVTVNENSDFDAIETNTFFSSLFMQQALYEAGKLKEVQFSVVANGAVNVTGDNVYAPEKALGIGPARVLIQEFPYSRSRFIDVALETAPAKLERLANKIVLETQNPEYQTIVAYRNGFRWVEGCERFYLDEKNESQVYKENGVYLITGGIGGIGLLTANTIARDVRCTFVLTYNSPIPARDEWDSWLEQNPGLSFTREKIEGIRNLEATGARVIERMVNVADYGGMKRMVEEVEAIAGPINGVIHSAGTVGGGVIPLKKRESVKPVFDSKFRGTVVLDCVFAGRELDFFVLYSSVTSILGEGTRLDYCSGNAFLDAFASGRKFRLGDRSSSVDWAGWKGTGMAVRWEKEKAEKSRADSMVAAKVDNSSKTVLRPSKDWLQPESITPEKEIYTITFNPEKDWIINSHFIISQPTVVGTSFLEIVHQYGRTVLNKNIEIRNIFFVSPLMFEGGKLKKVRMVVDKVGNKQKFSFKSQPMNKDAETDIWHDHFFGEVVISEKQPDAIRLDDILARLGENVDTGKMSRIVYNSQNQPLIDLGRRWDIDNAIHTGTNEWLAKLTLLPEFNGDTEYVDFHPAIMDKATSYALRYVSGATYLPFSYKSVRPYEKIPGEVYAYATLSHPVKPNDDAVSFDITLISTTGSVMMEIKEYTLKQVNNLPGAGGAKRDGDKTTADVLSDTFDYIDPENGEKIIGQILCNDCPEQFIVYPCDFDFMLADNLPDLQKRAEKSEKEKANKSYYARPDQGTAYVEPANEMEKTIAKIWQDILGLDKVGRFDTFTELGGNSLLAIQTIANMVDVLEVEISAQVFYGNPTVKGLAEAVVATIIGMNDMDNLEEIMESMNLDGEELGN